MISAFTYSHVAYDRMFKEGESRQSILLEEQSQKVSNMSLAPDVSVNQKSQAPTLDDLLANSSIV